MPMLGDQAAFKEKGIREYVDSYTNQLFVILTEEQAEVLGKKNIPLNTSRIWLMEVR